jgi:predicted SAM-dependent methyltransferase
VDDWRGYTVSNELKFKAKYEGMLSINSYTINELAHYEENEWEFENGETLASFDLDQDELEFIPANPELWRKND